MAERQATHRQDLEKWALHSNNIREIIGQAFGLIVALTSILSGVYLILHDKSVAGLVSILGTVATLAGIFVYGKHIQKKELSQKKF